MQSQISMMGINGIGYQQQEGSAFELEEVKDN